MATSGRDDMETDLDAVQIDEDGNIKLKEETTDDELDHNERKRLEDLERQYDSAIDSLLAANSSLPRRIKLTTQSMLNCESFVN